MSTLADESFDFTAPTSGPRNVVELERMMSERGIANDDSLEFNVEFVEQFYDDTDDEPGEHSMHNGNPCVWGFVYWKFLFLLAYYYPDKPNNNVKRATYQSVDAWRHILPCSNCIRHFRKIILELPIEKFLESRESFLEFCIELRHLVDTRLGKEPFDIDAFFKAALTCEKGEQFYDMVHELAEKNVSDAPVIEKKEEPPMQEQIIVQRRDIQKSNFARAVEQPSTVAQQQSSQQTVQKTSYGLVGRQINSTDSLKSVREAIRRNGLSNQQKANIQKLARSKTAKQVEKPGECKTCGGKPKKPSAF